MDSDEGSMLRRGAGYQEVEERKKAKKRIEGEERQLGERQREKERGWRERISA